MYLQYSNRQEIINAKNNADTPSNVLLVSLENLLVGYLLITATQSSHLLTFRGNEVEAWLSAVSFSIPRDRGSVIPKDCHLADSTSRQPTGAHWTAHTWLKVGWPCVVYVDHPHFGPKHLMCKILINWQLRFVLKTHLPDCNMTRLAGHNLFKHPLPWLNCVCQICSQMCQSHWKYCTWSSALLAWFTRSPLLRRLLAFKLLCSLETPLRQRR